MPSNPASTRGSATPPESHRASEADLLSQAAVRNLEIAMSLRATAWRLAEAGVRTFRPELSEQEVQDEVRAQFRRTAG